MLLILNNRQLMNLIFIFIHRMSYYYDEDLARGLGGMAIKPAEGCAFLITTQHVF